MVDCRKASGEDWYWVQFVERVPIVEVAGARVNFYRSPATGGEGRYARNLRVALRTYASLQLTPSKITDDLLAIMPVEGLEDLLEQFLAHEGEFAEGKDAPNFLRRQWAEAQTANQRPKNKGYAAAAAPEGEVKNFRNKQLDADANGLLGDDAANDTEEEAEERSACKRVLCILPERGVKVLASVLGHLIHPAPAPARTRNCSSPRGSAGSRALYNGGSTPAAYGPYRPHSSSCASASGSWGCVYPATKRHCRSGFATRSTKVSSGKVAIRAKKPGREWINQSRNLRRRGKAR